MAKDKAKRRVLHTNVIVIGMGRFGSSLALELMRTGHEVLGVDTDERLVQQMAQELTHTVKADTTEEAVLQELGIQEFDAAVAFGSCDGFSKSNTNGGVLNTLLASSTNSYIIYPFVPLYCIFSCRY